MARTDASVPNRPRVRAAGQLTGSSAIGPHTAIAGATRWPPDNRKSQSCCLGASLVGDDRRI